MAQPQFANSNTPFSVSNTHGPLHPIQIDQTPTPTVFGSLYTYKTLSHSHTHTFHTPNPRFLFFILTHYTHKHDVPHKQHRGGWPQHTLPPAGPLRRGRLRLHPHPRRGRRHRLPEGDAVPSPHRRRLRGPRFHAWNRGVPVPRQRGALHVPSGDVLADPGDGAVHRVRAVRDQQEGGAAGFGKRVRRVQGRGFLALVAALCCE